MAGTININSVYKTVLVILEQEKRGVLLPSEFNRIATQAQQEIYTQYFDDLNQVLRLPQTNLAYADRFALLDEKISLFKRIGTFTLDLNQETVIPSTVQELGVVVYNNREAERIQTHEVYTTNISPLTAPTLSLPVYTYENNTLKIYPQTATGTVSVNYLKYPDDVKWGFTIDKELGNYVYNEFDSTSFEIHQLDQPLLISKILGFAGVVTKDQFVSGIAQQKEAQINGDNVK
tara:strand:+ start:111 stop:809 length:699 start_codon:yes stop_codon:yes gene_type:complete